MWEKFAWLLWVNDLVGEPRHVFLAYHRTSRDSFGIKFPCKNFDVVCVKFVGFSGKYPRLFFV